MYVIYMHTYTILSIHTSAIATACETNTNTHPKQSTYKYSHLHYTPVWDARREWGGSDCSSREPYMPMMLWSRSRPRPRPTSGMSALPG